MKVTKATLAIGMVFISKPFEGLEFKLEDGLLNMRPEDYLIIDTAFDLIITDTLKRYPCGHGYSGEMVKFKVRGYEQQEFVAFWSNFKAATQLKT